MLHLYIAVIHDFVERPFILCNVGRLIVGILKVIFQPTLLVIPILLSIENFTKSHLEFDAMNILGLAAFHTPRLSTFYDEVILHVTLVLLCKNATDFVVLILMFKETGQQMIK